MMMMINRHTPKWLSLNLRDLLGDIKHGPSANVVLKSFIFFLLLSSFHRTLFSPPHIMLMLMKMTKVVGKKRVFFCCLCGIKFSLNRWNLGLDYITFQTNLLLSHSFNKIATNFLLFRYVLLMEMKQTCVWEINLHMEKETMSWGGKVSEISLS